jgi:hypothetical protein
LKGITCHDERPEYEQGSVADVFQLVDTVAKKLRRYQRQTIDKADLTPGSWWSWLVRVVAPLPPSPV